MRMDILRCRTPGMVEKELWAHLLAYNLLRAVDGRGRGRAGIEPREVSFKGAKQVVTAFAPKLEAAAAGGPAGGWSTPSWRPSRTTGWGTGRGGGSRGPGSGGPSTPPG